MIKRIKSFFSKKQNKPSADEKFKNAILAVQAFQIKYINDYRGITITSSGNNYVSVFIHSVNGIHLHFDMQRTNSGLYVCVSKMINDEKISKLLSTINEYQK